MITRPKLAVKLLIYAVLLVVAFILMSGAIARVKCAVYGSQTERETRYGVFVGCMVKSGDGWIPKTEIRTSVQ